MSATSAGLTAPFPAPLRAAGPPATLSLGGWSRLAAVVVGCLLLVVEPARVSGGVVVAAAAITGLTIWERWRSRPVPFVDAAVALGAVLVSGGWTSPFGPVLGVDVATAGLRGGYGRGARVAALQTVALLGGTALAGQPLAGQLPLVLVLAAAAGGFGQRVLADSRRDAADALGQLDALRRTNRLLADVHGALRTLPTAPDARTVAALALSRLRAEIPFRAGMVYLRARGGSGWELLHAVGAPTDEGDQLQLPLEVRGTRIGWLALEHDDPDVDLDGLAAAADALALALDNARWLDRLTTLSGEFERTRLARDLHDRLCQSLAAVSIALQRAAARTDAADLAELGVRVREDLADLRETLFELRAGPPAAGDLAEAVLGYVQRVAARAGLRADVDVACPGGRLPLAVEQQLFRILQELLRNAVRHAGARHVTVTWRVDADRAVLEVEDDGRGFDPDAPGGGSGLASVRERADALGASCDVDSHPGEGTAVAVTIDRRPVLDPGGQP